MALAVSTVDGLLPARPEEAEKSVFLHRLSLFNFRNYVNCTVRLDGCSAVLTGSNGCGKTNILEGISLLTPGRGIRGAAFDDLARLSGDGSWAVSAELNLNGESVKLGTGRQAEAVRGNSGRTVRIDGETAAGSGALGDYLQVLWLIPAMDGLFTGPGSERRRFLDRIVATFDAAHRSRLNQFERAMRQRNRMLEMGERSDRMFDAIESQMAETGTAIAAARIEAVERLSAVMAGPAAAREAQHAFPHAEFALEGVLEEAILQKPAVDVEDDYARQLSAERDRDRAAGRTLTGPHRADLSVTHGPKAMPARLCSTGEQKALLINLILAHAKALKQARGGLAPLLLLDEIVAHLDVLRREALFEEIEALGAQAWLTGTDPDVFEPLRTKAQFLTVTDGSIAAGGAVTA